MKSIKDDTRGAVMFLGVFFGCFLVGSLWFMIGIGDALVIRERAQEAADASAFASAVVHAKGMNIIAFINTLILILVGIYLILCLVVDLLLALAALAAVVPVIGWAAAVKLIVAAQRVDTFAARTKTPLKTATFLLSTTQTATAYVAPWVGVAVGGRFGNKYENMSSIVLSPSLIPGAAVGSALGFANQAILKLSKSSTAPDTSAGGKLAGEASKKLGLPVQIQKLQESCRIAFVFVVEKIAELVNGLPLVGRFIAFAMRSVRGLGGDAIVALHCAEKADGQRPSNPSTNLPTKAPAGSNGGKAPPGERGDSEDGKTVTPIANSIAGFFFKVYEPDALWGEKYGPKKMFSPARNGAAWMQVYSLTMTTPTDTSQRIVERAAYKFDGAPQLDLPITFKAQAEFYYDCNEEWSQPDCNGDGLYWHRAIYSMRWRARIVRYTGFSVSSLAGDWVTALLGSSAAVEPLRKAIAKHMPYVAENLGPFLNNLLIGNGRNGDKALLDRAVKLAADNIGDVVRPEVIPESYH
jgi:hypothetical protein